MRPAIRNIASTLFILLGLIPVIFIIVFSITRNSIRQEMKEKMETQHLHTIILAEKEIQWAKAGREIWVDGKLFDIKSAQQKDGNTIFKGLFDNEETLLNQNFSKSWEKDQAKKNQLIGQMFQTFQSFYFTDAQSEIIIQKNAIPQIEQYSSALLNQFLEIPTPPPLS